MSRDFRAPDGGNVWGDIRLDLLEDAGVAWDYLEADVPVLTAELVAGYDAVLFTGPSIEAETFNGSDADGPLLFARFGVGVDTVDLRACTRHGALVTITPDGARRPVATAALTLLLAVSTRLVLKDRLTRRGEWGDRAAWMGRGLSGRTVGIVGFGSSAADLVNLLRPFDVRVVAADPFKTEAQAAALQVTLLPLDQLMATADAVVVTATYSPSTHHLLDERAFALMRPGGIVVNVSRGPIIDEGALIEALRNGHLYGAGLDVFEREPLDDDNPLLTMPHVVLSPHCLAWTDEMSRGNGASAARAILDVRDRRVPPFLVNRDVLENARARNWFGLDRLESTS